MAYKVRMRCRDRLITLNQNVHESVTSAWLSQVDRIESGAWDPVAASKSLRDCRNDEVIRANWSAEELSDLASEASADPTERVAITVVVVRRKLWLKTEIAMLMLFPEPEHSRSEIYIDNLDAKVL